MEVFLLIILALVIAAFVIAANKKSVEREKAKQIDEQEDKIRDTFLENLNDIIIQHSDALLRKAKQKITRGVYGELVMDKWRKEVNYFIKTAVEPEIEAFERSQEEVNPDYDLDRKKMYDLIFEVINSAILPVIDEQEGIEEIEELTPAEFEGMCANTLEENGWETNLTPGSGDQGVDVIAKREGIRVTSVLEVWG